MIPKSLMLGLDEVPPREEHRTKTERRHKRESSRNGAHAQPGRSTCAVSVVCRNPKRSRRFFSVLTSSHQ